MMTPYKNLSFNSPVQAYELHETYMIVEFIKPNKKGYKYYRYGYIKPGTHELEQMKMLAKQGQGLASYISREVGKDYEDRYKQYE